MLAAMIRPAQVIVVLVACSSTESNRKYFEDNVGKSVKLVGQVAKTPWQHMTKHVAGKTIAYIDLDGGKHQIVGYFAAEPSCPGEVAFEGTVFEVRGPSKAAKRGEPGAANDEFWEYAVDVASWRCR